MAFPPGLKRGFSSFRTVPTTSVAATAADPAPAGAQDPLPLRVPTINTPAAPAPPATVNPVTVTGGPTTSAAGRFGAQVLGGLRGVGKAIGNNPGQALAIAQGAAGLLTYGTAKNPGELPAPKPYTPPIRGAQGLESSSYTQARNDIASTQAVASTADSSDVATTAVQRLLAQRQTNAALGTLAGQNNQAYQTDRGRQSDQEMQAYQTNYAADQQYTQNAYAEKRRLYEARRMQAGAQVQGAIDSISGSWQAQQQASQGKLEVQNRQAEARITAVHNGLAGATTREQVQTYLQELKKLDPSGTTYQRAMQTYGNRYGITSLAAGGSLPTGQVKWTTPKGSTAAAGNGKGLRARSTSPVSVENLHKMSQEFGRHLDRFATQSRASFDRSLQTAYGLRSGLGGGGRTAPAFARRR